MPTNKERQQLLEEGRAYFYSKRLSAKEKPDFTASGLGKLKSKLEYKQQILDTSAILAQSRTSSQLDNSLAGEGKQRVKVSVTNEVYKSDRSLLLEERARNKKLEESYHQLVSQVQHLQSTHLQDIRASESKFHSATATLQKALVSKSEELIALGNRLSSAESASERESREWSKERSQLKALISTLSTREAEQSQKILDREKKIGEINRLRKVLAERVSSKETELAATTQRLTSSITEYNSEKEIRIKTEIKIQKLQQEFDSQKQKLMDVSDLYNRLKSEAGDIEQFRIYEKAQQVEKERFERQEKQFESEISHLHLRERRQAEKIDNLEKKEQKNASEMAELLKARDQFARQCDESSIRENDLRRILEKSNNQIQQHKEEIKRLEGIITQYKQESSKLLGDFSQLQLQNQDLQAENQSLNRERTNLKTNLDTLKKERDSDIQELHLMNQDLNSTHLNAEQLSQECKDLSRRLQKELDDKAAQKLEHRERFASVSTKISGLQKSLNETAKQLSTLLNTEKQLKSALEQRDESLRQQSLALTDLKRKYQELLETCSKDKTDFESYKLKKREEFLGLQEKYSRAKKAMDAEISKIAYQYSQKNNEASIAVDEINNMRRDIKELTSQNHHLEQKLEEFAANENNLARQINTLTATLTTKQNELQKLLSKNTQLVEKNQRLQDELFHNRDPQRDGDISQLKSNMEEISKRLKSQVDGLLERDENYSVFSPSVSKFGHNSRNSTSGSVKMSPPRSRLFSNNDDAGSPRNFSRGTLPDPSGFEHTFDSIDRLLSRTNL